MGTPLQSTHTTLHNTRAAHFLTAVGSKRHAAAISQHHRSRSCQWYISAKDAVEEMTSTLKTIKLIYSKHGNTVCLNGLRKATP